MARVSSSSSLSSAAGVFAGEMYLEAGVVGEILEASLLAPAEVMLLFDVVHCVEEACEVLTVVLMVRLPMPPSRDANGS